MGLTTLFLPGMHGTSRLFGRLLKVLPVGLTPRVVTYPTDQVLGYDALLQRIELPHEPFAIVAESYSGPLAIRLAARRPGNLRAMILVATFVRSPWRVVPRCAAHLVRPWLFSLPLPHLGVRWTLLGNDAPREQITEVCQELQRCCPEVFAARVRDVLRVDVRSDLRSVAFPMLYVGGSRDRVIPLRAALELKGLRPDIEQIFLDSPHAVLECRPTESAALIGWFLLEKTLGTES